MAEMIALVTNQVRILEKNGPTVCDAVNMTYQRFDDLKKLFNAMCNEEFVPRLIVIDLEYLSGIDHIAPFEVSQLIHVLSKMFDKSVQPSIAVLLNKDDDPILVKTVLNSEIDGVIPKVNWLGFDASIEAYRNLLNRRKYFPKIVIENFIKSATKKKITKKSTQIELTPRQTQVLHLVCERGASNKNIARILRISESTVKLHVSAILKKYGATNRTQLVLIANQKLEKAKA